ncbi:hypothetical protein [Streptomyces sp. NPDC093089]|uniref:hypothetical protein n=1 Tax=Streptomyces sp. NPDC093089 TaxID=3366024 RepID=UPI0038187802
MLRAPRGERVDLGPYDASATPAGPAGEAAGLAASAALAPRPRLDLRYDEINRFEKALADDGVTLVKVFLHLPYEEQRARLLEALAPTYPPGDFDVERCRARLLET